MKRIKRILSLTLILLPLFCFFACNDNPEKCTEHKNENGDGVCDACGEALTAPKDGIVLAENGEFKFSFVIGEGAESIDIIQALDALNEILERFDTEIEIKKKNSSESGTEVLIGTVPSRGEEYSVDRYSLGKDGYIIKAVGGKILIHGGSEESLMKALNKFIEDVIGIDEKTSEIGTIVFDESDSTEKIQDDYKIKSVTLDGTDIKGYKIYTDSTDNFKFTAYLDAAAKRLQSFLYEKAGYYLPIEDISSAKEGERAVYLRGTAKGNAGEKGFRVIAEDGSLIIECAHHNAFEEVFETYFNKTFAFFGSGELKLKSYESEKDIRIVFYSDFGAIGDGETDDYEAIYAAHLYANEGGQTVYADYGKKYLIRDVVSTIPVQTDVNWNGATVIFDNRHITSQNNGAIFNISSLDSVNHLSASELAELNAKKNDDGYVLSGMGSENPSTNIGFAPGYPAFITIYNTKHNNYIRYGYADNNGSAQREVLLVNADGDIDPSTPLLHDFSAITSIDIVNVDIETLCFENGNIETWASLMYSGKGEYLSRNIVIRRPNTTISNIHHKVIGEIPNNEPVRTDENGLCYSVASEGFYYNNGKIYDKNGIAYSGTDVKPYSGYAYNGIISASNTHNTRVKGCTFQARVYYKAGTYDIGATMANALVFEDCIQSNFYQTDAYGNLTDIPNMGGKCWGITGTNYCKNMEFIRCEFTRYDAHSGVTNGKIIDSKIAVLTLIGGGEFLIENTTIAAYNSAPLTLRDDYGSSFLGTITVRNCNIVDYTEAKTLVRAVFAIKTPNYYNGYTAYCPNIIIDNLEIETKRDTIELITSNATSPVRSIFTDAVHDPDALFDYHYLTSDKNYFKDHPVFGKYLADHKLDTVNNKDGTYTLILRQIPNACIYTPPELIEVKNNSGKSYRLVLYNSDFFENTKITEDSNNLIRKDQ